MYENPGRGHALSPLLPAADAYVTQYWFISTVQQQLFSKLILFYFVLFHLYLYDTRETVDITKRADKNL